MEKSVNLADISKEDLIRELEKRQVKCLDPEEVFAYKVWCRDDIRELIRDLDPRHAGEQMAENDAFIEAVVKHGGAWHALTDCTEAEWDSIQYAIEKVAKPASLY